MNILAKFLVLCSAIVGGAAIAAPPQLYRQSANESPVRADPDDLLMLPGDGLAADDVVVYRSLRQTTLEPAAPARPPPASTADFGIAEIVSSAGVPNSLTIKLPQFLRRDQSYALWVRSARGEWSAPVKINDARPLWFSPSTAYASGSAAGLPRELKVVGRNLQPSAGQSTRLRLTGPGEFRATALADARSSATIDQHVARFALPAFLPAGNYRVLLSRDGNSWVEVANQMLEVRSRPALGARYSVNDPQFGGCRPDDGADDTPCVIKAISAAARAGGGSVYFGPGIWDLIDSAQAGITPHEGIHVAIGVNLEGAGSDRSRIVRHAEWNATVSNPAFTLLGRTLVTGLSLHDVQVYRPNDRAAAFLQLGVDFQRAAANPGSPGAPARVDDVTITRNVFDKPIVAIAASGLPINRLVVTSNTFGAYASALELGGDRFNMKFKYRIDDSIIAHNMFKPGSNLDVHARSGTIASEIGAAHRLDFSDNTADGSSTDYLYSPDDARGWRAAFFWNMNDNLEEMLVAQNTATCTGDKVGDGEAISYDNNANTFGFKSAATVVHASPESIVVSVALAARQNERDVPIDSYYVGHWIQVVSGPGIGQARKITGYSFDASTRATSFVVAPAWDVVPIEGRSRIAVGREYWQVYTLDNFVDQRKPLCQKSNRSNHAGGVIALWAQSADSVIEGNRQFDTDGILVQQNYEVPEHACADCTMSSFFQEFLDIRNNTIDGKYDWGSNCSSSGIQTGVAAVPWGDAVPPTVSYGVSISHNTVRRADGKGGGAIAQGRSAYAGPEPHRWPLSDNMLIHHNVIREIDGPEALPSCAKPVGRIGINFPDYPIAWRTVLYANSCSQVSVPLGSGGVDTVRVCPSSAPDSCECAP